MNAEEPRLRIHQASSGRRAFPDVHYINVWQRGNANKALAFSPPPGSVWSELDYVPERGRERPSDKARRRERAGERDGVTGRGRRERERDRVTGRGDERERERGTTGRGDERKGKNRPRHFFFIAVDNYEPTRKVSLCCG